MDIDKVLHRLLVSQFSKKLCKNSFIDLLFMLVLNHLRVLTWFTTRLHKIVKMATYNQQLLHLAPTSHNCFRFQLSFSFLIEKCSSFHEWISEGNCNKISNPKEIFSYSLLKLGYSVSGLPKDVYNKNGFLFPKYKIV